MCDQSNFKTAKLGNRIYVTCECVEGAYSENVELGSFASEYEAQRFIKSISLDARKEFN